VSAVILVATPFASTRAEPTHHSLFAEARAGLTAAARMPVVRVVLWASSLTALFAAMMNVGELFLARKLGGGATGYAVIVTAFGCGMIAGSAYGARTATPQALRSRYLSGILLVGAALTSIAGGGCLIVRAAAGRALARDATVETERYAGAPTPLEVDDASMAARTASV